MSKKLREPDVRRRHETHGTGVTMNGTFNHLVDKHFFVGCLVVRVWGQRRRVLGDGVEFSRETNIAGPSSPYARVAMG